MTRALGSCTVRRRLLAFLVVSSAVPHLAGLPRLAGSADPEAGP